MNNYFLQNDVRDYLEKKISNTKIEIEYFPYINIPNFLPEDLYTMVIDNNPFKEIKGNKWNHSLAKYYNFSSKTKYENRYQYDLKNDVLNKDLDKKKKKFWQDFYLLFNDQDWFLKVIQKKFYTFFKFKYGNFFNDKNYNFFETKFFLQRHTKNYELSVHTDVPTRTFTALFSFPSKKGFEKYGTNIHVPKKKNQRCPGFKHYKENKFELVKTIDYSPNNFFLFFNTEFSYHSVSRFDKEIIDDRFGMQFQLFEKDNLFEYLSSKDLKSSKNLTGRILKYFNIG